MIAVTLYTTKEASNGNSKNKTRTPAHKTLNSKVFNELIEHTLIHPGLHAQSNTLHVRQMKYMYQHII